MGIVAAPDSEHATVVVDDCRGDTDRVLRCGQVCQLVYLSGSVVELVHSIDPSSDRPAYKQIADHLRELIAAGELAPSEALPSERVLMARYGAARGTVRQAIDVLKAEGLIQVEHGRGSFVRARPPVRRRASDRFARRHRDAGRGAFIAETEDEGRRPEIEMLRLGREKPPAKIAELLGLDEDTPVLVRHRRYLADGQPLELATSYIPWDLANGTHMTRRNSGPGGIYARLEEIGHRLGRFTEEISSRMPTPDEMRSLRLGPGVPVFHLVRTAFDTRGRVVEVCDTVMAADRYILSYELPAR